jgi:hypothetical protein
MFEFKGHSTNYHNMQKQFLASFKKLGTMHYSVPATTLVPKPLLVRHALKMQKSYDEKEAVVHKQQYGEKRRGAVQNIVERLRRKRILENEEEQHDVTLPEPDKPVQEQPNKDAVQAGINLVKGIVPDRGSVNCLDPGPCHSDKGVSVWEGADAQY